MIDFIQFLARDLFALWALRLDFENRVPNITQDWMPWAKLVAQPWVGPNVHFFVPKPLVFARGIPRIGQNYPACGRGHAERKKNNHPEMQNIKSLTWQNYTNKTRTHPQEILLLSRISCICCVVGVP